MLRPVDAEVNRRHTRADKITDDVADLDTLALTPRQV